jgi:hypothetical protein
MELSMESSYTSQDDLLEKDGLQRKERPKSTARQALWRCVILALLSCTLAFLLYGTQLYLLDPARARSAHMHPATTSVYNGPPTHHHEEEHTILDCGTSIPEAIQRGCTLDVMAGIWLPAACYDAAVAREGASNETELAGLRGSGLFEWALEHNHTTAVAQEELWKLESLTAHTWYEYHTAHCMYIWHLAGIAWDAVLRGDSPVYIPSKAVDHKHVHHCRKVVAIGPKMSGVSVQVFFGFGTCTRWDKSGDSDVRIPTL